jgi:hypothetical protein
VRRQLPKAHAEFSPVCHICIIPPSHEFESELLIYEEFKNEKHQLEKYAHHFAFSADP